MLCLRSFNRIILISLALLGLSVSSANAVVVGDKDWYQVSDLTSNSWNEFDAIFDTSTGECDVVGCLLGGTTDLTGYKWASNADVNSLISNYYVGTGLSDANTPDEFIFVDPGGLDAIFSDFNATISTAEAQRIYGFTRETIGPGLGTYIRIWDNLNLSLDDHLLREIHLSSGSSGTEFGGWVYRDVSAVPAPAAVWLFGTALAGLVGFSKRKSRVAA